MRKTKQKRLNRTKPAAKTINSPAVVLKNSKSVDNQFVTSDDDTVFARSDSSIKSPPINDEQMIATSNETLESLKKSLDLALFLIDEKDHKINKLNDIIVTKGLHESSELTDENLSSKNIYIKLENKIQNLEMKLHNQILASLNENHLDLRTELETQKKTYEYGLFEADDKINKLSVENSAHKRKIEELQIIIRKLENESKQKTEIIISKTKSINNLNILLETSLNKNLESQNKVRLDHEADLKIIEERYRDQMETLKSQHSFEMDKFRRNEPNGRQIKKIDNETQVNNDIQFRKPRKSIETKFKRIILNNRKLFIEITENNLSVFTSVASKLLKCIQNSEELNADNYSAEIFSNLENLSRWMVNEVLDRSLEVHRNGFDNSSLYRSNLDQIEDLLSELADEVYKSMQKLIEKDRINNYDLLKMREQKEAFSAATDLRISIDAVDNSYDKLFRKKESRTGQMLGEAS